MGLYDVHLFMSVDSDYVSLSGPCELLFLLCLIAPWTREKVSAMLYPRMFCAALPIDPFVFCVACL